jgi:hypothetical protein
MGSWRYWYEPTRHDTDITDNNELERTIAGGEGWMHMWSDVHTNFLADPEVV